MKIFDLSLRLNGFPIKKARTHLKAIQNQTDYEFKEYLERKKKEIVIYHIRHNSFYNNFISGIDVSDWNKVPVMTKRDLQKPLAERLSRGFTTKSVYINKTSGSSGDPFIFAKDKFCHALTWAEIQDRFSWYKIDFNSSKQARFYGIPLDKKGYFKERLKDMLSNRFRFSIFDLSDDELKKNLKKFERTKFDYIDGYTSSIVQFAKYINRNNIILKNICPSLKVCITTAEMLFDSDKKLLEDTFGIPVVNEYGASELDLIAFLNPMNEWQVNSETLFVEILDNNGNVLPHGEEGRIIITSLYNKAHPFIRYDIGDIGVLSKKSTLEKPVLENIIGRTNDIAILPSGKKAAGLTFYYITKSIIEDDGNVKEFIIEQTTKSHFKIKYVSANELSKTKVDIIKDEIENYLESGLDITFERHEFLRRSKSGKLKQFASHLNNFGFYNS